MTSTVVSVIDGQAEGDDEGAERNALQVDAEPFHDRENDRHRQRNPKSDDRAGPEAETDDAHRHDDSDRLPERLHELTDGGSDDDRLIGHQRRVDAEGQIGNGLADRLFHIAAERQDIGIRFPVFRRLAFLDRLVLLARVMLFVGGHDRRVDDL
jgi:hypothetical protein